MFTLTSGESSHTPACFYHCLLSDGMCLCSGIVWVPHSSVQFLTLSQNDHRCHSKRYSSTTLPLFQMPVAKGVARLLPSLITHPGAPITPLGTKHCSSSGLLGDNEDEQ